MAAARPWFFNARPWFFYGWCQATILFWLLPTNSAEIFRQRDSIEKNNTLSEIIKEKVMPLSQTIPKRLKTGWLFPDILISWWILNIRGLTAFMLVNGWSFMLTWIVSYGEFGKSIWKNILNHFYAKKTIIFIIEFSRIHAGCFVFTHSRIKRPIMHQLRFGPAWGLAPNGAPAFIPFFHVSFSPPAVFTCFIKGN